jgi:son of sevenless
MMFNELKDLFNVESNYNSYKKILISQPPPIIPYIGVYLRDLTFLELGNSEYLNEEKGILNYDKYRMISSVIIEFQTFQEIPYDFEENGAILRLLSNHMVSFDDDRLYDMSLILEPPANPQTGTPKEPRLNSSLLVRLKRH